MSRACKMYVKYLIKSGNSLHDLHHCGAESWGGRIVSSARFAPYAIFIANWPHVIFLFVYDANIRMNNCAKNSTMNYVQREQGGEQII